VPKLTELKGVLKIDSTFKCLPFKFTAGFSALSLALCHPCRFVQLQLHLFGRVSADVEAFLLLGSRAPQRLGLCDADCCLRPEAAELMLSF